MLSGSIMMIKIADFIFQNAAVRSREDARVSLSLISIFFYGFGFIAAYRRSSLGLKIVCIISVSTVMNFFLKKVYSNLHCFQSSKFA